MYKELKIVVKEAQQRAGWCLVNSGKHYMLVHPSGVKTQVARSPSDRNAHKSLERRLLHKEREIAEREVTA